MDGPHVKWNELLNPRQQTLYYQMPKRRTRSSTRERGCAEKKCNCSSDTIDTFCWGLLAILTSCRPTPTAMTADAARKSRFSRYPETKLSCFWKTLRSGKNGFTDAFSLVRLFYASGADPDGELDESHDMETHLIPLAISDVLTGSGYGCLARLSDNRR